MYDDIYSLDYLAPNPRIKLILMGDVHTGKTSIICSLKGEQFVPDYLKTLGIDFNAHALSIKTQYEKIRVVRMINLHLWDISGNRRFRDITSVYYRNIDGAIIVFDVTSRESYNSVPYWLGELTNNIPSIPGEKQNISYPILLIGNKSDLSDRVVSTIEAVNFAKENSLLYSETSAKTGSGISAAFNILTRSIISSHNFDTVPETNPKSRCVLL